MRAQLQQVQVVPRAWGEGSAPTSPSRCSRPGGEGSASTSPSRCPRRGGLSLKKSKQVSKTWGGSASTSPGRCPGPSCAVWSEGHALGGVRCKALNEGRRKSLQESLPSRPPFRAWQEELEDLPQSPHELSELPKSFG